jgi:hypothetical protein
MKRFFWLVFLGCLPACATTRYVAQTAGTFSGGSACNGQTAITPGTFNSTALAAGDLTYICGTITASAGANAFIWPENGGSSGNPVEILFDAGAILEAPYWGTDGAILVASNYILVDGGSNGIIESTANGTGLANSTSSTAGLLDTGSNDEIRNLTVENIYVHTANTADTADGTQAYCIYVLGGSSNLVHGNTLHDCGAAIRYAYETSSGFQAYNNTIYNINWGIIVGDADPSETLTGTVAVYNNTIHDWALWDQTDDNNHHDGIYFFATNTGSVFQNGYIYNNYLYGDPGEYMNTMIYLSNLPQTCGGNYVFNNVLVNTSGTTNDTPANGLIQDWCNADFILNNTLVGITQSSTNPENNSNPGLMVNVGTATTLENNIIQLFRNGTGMGSGSSITAQDYNDYYDNTDPAWDNASNIYATLSAYQACHTNGCPAGTHDTHSTIANPLLTGTYHLTSSSSAAWQTGVNLYSTCNGQATPGLGALCSDKSGTVRPTSGAWDMGAFESSGSGSSSEPTVTSGKTSTSGKTVTR